MGVFVSKKQYDQACSVDLYEFLLRNHSYAVKVEYGSVLLLADKHVSVKKGFHGYRNFRTGETGNNVDYLTNFLEYGYQDAVLALIGGNMVVDYIPKVSLQMDSKEIVIPEPTKGPYRNLYLHEKFLWM